MADIRQIDLGRPEALGDSVVKSRSVQRVVGVAWAALVAAGILIYTIGGWSVDRAHWLEHVVAWWQALLGAGST